MPIYRTAKQNNSDHKKAKAAQSAQKSQGFLQTIRQRVLAARKRTLRYMGKQAKLLLHSWLIIHDDKGTDEISASRDLWLVAKDAMLIIGLNFVKGWMGGSDVETIKVDKIGESTWAPATTTAQHTSPSLPYRSDNSSTSTNEVTDNIISDKDVVMPQKDIIPKRSVDEGYIDEEKEAARLAADKKKGAEARKNAEEVHKRREEERQKAEEQSKTDTEEKEQKSSAPKKAPQTEKPKKVEKVESPKRDYTIPLNITVPERGKGAKITEEDGMVGPGESQMVKVDSNEITLEDMLRSSGHPNIPNIPDETQLAHLAETIVFANWLQKSVGMRFHITSGFRCAALNKAVGGSRTSAHLTGYAFDFVVDNMDYQQYATEIALFLVDNDYPFDQLLIEQKGGRKWIHIGYKRNDGTQRKIFNFIGEPKWEIPFKKRIYNNRVDVNTGNRNRQ